MKIADWKLSPLSWIWYTPGAKSSDGRSIDTVPFSMNNAALRTTLPVASLTVKVTSPWMSVEPKRMVNSSVLGFGNVKKLNASEPQFVRIGP